MDEPDYKRSYEAYVRSAELENPDALINLGLVKFHLFIKLN